MKDVGPINCCLIRKTLVSKARQQGIDRSDQEAMARHMDHSIGTADRHYDVNTGIKITARFRQIIKRFDEDFDKSDSDDESDRTIPGDGDEDIPASQSTLFAKPLSCLVGNKVNSASLKIKSNPGVGLRRFGRECIFTEEEAERVKRCCTNVIEKGRKKDYCY